MTPICAVSGTASAVATGNGLLVLDVDGPEGAKVLAEIEAAIATLKATPHKGSLRGEIAPGLRAIPAGRKAVIAFVVDDEAAEVLIYAVTYGDADWAMRATQRRKER